MGLRITTLIFIFTLLYTGLGFNIYNLQISKGDYYNAKASSLYSASGVSIPSRGNIYFRDKDNNLIPAALDKEYPTIFANTKKIVDPTAAAKSLAEILKMPASSISKLLSKKDNPYVPLIRRATPSQIESLVLVNIPGVHIDYEPSRLYPFVKDAAHVLGFVSTEPDNLNGLYGIEKYYNTRLKGTPGVLKGEKTTSPIRGEDVRLTIDKNIQSQAESILSSLVADYAAVGGSILVQDPKTGQILAMASEPSFDPNNYGDYSIKSFLNPAAQSVYEPGSIFKVITMAAGIDSGAITPDTTYIDTGELTLNGKTIRNFDKKAHGLLTMTNVIEKSLNLGSAFAEKKMGHETFYNYLLKFGFKEATHIDLPGEVRGSLGQLEKNPRDINFATASFGQGISVTPIGLLKAISAIANHGVMMQPYLNADIEPQVLGRVISADTSRKVVDMMVGAVNKNEIARIKGYNIAGKTGTAQVPDFKNGGYTNDVINTFVGFVPAYNPKFVVMVKLDKAAGAPLAGLNVVPAFRQLTQFILNYYNIPPDNPKELENNQ